MTRLDYETRVRKLLHDQPHLLVTTYLGDMWDAEDDPMNVPDGERTKDFYLYCEVVMTS